MRAAVVAALLGSIAWQWWALQQRRIPFWVDLLETAGVIAVSWRGATPVADAARVLVDAARPLTFVYVLSGLAFRALYGGPLAAAARVVSAWAACSAGFLIGAGSLQIVNNSINRTNRTYMPTFVWRHDGPVWKADGGIGFLNGLLCGLTGFPGFIVTVWCQLRGWTKDVQRAVFQPVMLAAIVATAISLSFTGVVTAEIVKLYVLGLPALLAGLWVGFKLYGKLDEARFRRVVLVLLLFSGVSLIARW